MTCHILIGGVKTDQGIEDQKGRAMTSYGSGKPVLVDDAIQVERVGGNDTDVELVEYEAIRGSTPASLDLVVSVRSAASGSPLAADSAGQQDEGDNGPAPLPVVRASALENPGTRQRWLIEGLWTAQAVGVLGGAPKCLKSFLTLEMAVSVASGSPYLAKFPIHQRGPVLLYAAEDSPSDVRLRLESLAHHHKLEYKMSE